MFKSKKANIVLALLISISLWAYVTGSVNPEISSKFVNIPIKFINEDSLTSNGLAIDSIENAYIDVTVRGTRTDVKDLEEEDIKVVADMYNRYMGNNYVPIEVNLPKGIELESKSIDKIHVVIGAMIHKDFDIEVDTEGTLESGYALGETELSPDVMRVTGTEKNLNHVNKVVARLDASQVNEEEGSYQCDLNMLDRNGNKVNFVAPVNDTVMVTTKLEKIKKVPLKVNVVGEPAEGYEKGDVNYPTEVNIVGRSKTIDAIDEIQAKDVDIDGLGESKDFLLEFNLPEGVRIASDKSLSIHVDIIAPKEKTFVYNPHRIEIKNLAEGYEGKLLDDVKIKVKGDQEIIERIVSENIVIAVDADGLGAGEHPVTVQAYFKSQQFGDDVTIAIENETVTLVIEQK